MPQSNDDHLWEWYIQTYGSRNPTEEHKAKIDAIRVREWEKAYERHKKEMMPTLIELKKTNNLEISDIVDQYQLNYYLGNAVKSLLENDLDQAVFYISKEIARINKTDKTVKLVG